eukprot:TRINITY_DN51971_c0_g1_i1.p1 TRINITY_DN51971_c0_g1~~TRINITY_DN51971_c0_g1_i1.p1  ORF type:complete len:204 (-),score=30.81 TRINITY_DN51971_c0_g1_i1:47-658(-)
MAAVSAPTSEGQWQPILVRVTEQARSGNASSVLGQPFIDLSLSCRPSDVTCLAFQNSFTASVMLEQRPCGQPQSELRIVLPWRRLMKDSNCEDDGQAWNIIYKSQLQLPLIVLPEDGEPCQVALRVHLQQSSPNFSEYSLTNFKAFKFTPKAMPPAVSHLSVQNFIREADGKLMHLRRSAQQKALAARRLETTVRDAYLKTSA